MVKKILLLGRPAMGKTTIKNVIFNDEEPNDLILFPLETTVDIKYSIHEFLDLRISLLDTAGQSLQIYLNNEEKQIEIFGDTGALIYIFDYNIWLSKPQVIIDDIRRICKINENNLFGVKIFLFFHKIDLIYQVNAKKLSTLRSTITNKLALPFELPIYFTSLYPDLIYSTYNAFFDIISNFSPDALNLKNVVHGVINGLSKTICFITNQKDYIIHQVMSKDLDINLIHSFHEKVYLLSQSPEKVSSKEDMKILELNSKFYYIAMDNINKFYSYFKKVIIISETLNKEKLIALLDILRNNLRKYFKQNIQAEVE